jgi:hypothetical protein
MASILRTLDVLKKLNDAGVEYVIIGGVAAILAPEAIRKRLQERGGK